MISLFIPWFNSTKLLVIHTLYHGQAPTLAIDPPTIRVWATFEIPHPSSGVSKRPVMFVVINSVAPDNAHNIV